MKHKFLTSFSSVVHCSVPEELDKYVAQAKSTELSKIIPSNIDLDKNYDLLATAFNACVINRANGNDDMLGTKETLSCYKSFIHKPINVEHNRKIVIGHLINAGLSKFIDPNLNTLDIEILSESEVKDSTSPFNLSLAGLIYKVSGEKLIDQLEQSNDPLSPYFLSISASWELGFDDYLIAISKNSGRDIDDCEIITDKEQLQELDPLLKANGGVGKAKDGRRIYRLIVGEVTPLGIGFTKTPAAEVKGVLVLNEDKENGEDSEASSHDEKISQTQKSSVKDDSMKFKIVASIDELKNIKQEDLAAYSIESIAGLMADQIQKAIQEKATEWKTQVDQKEKAATDALAKASDVEAKLTAVSAELDAMKAKIAAAAATELFNNRMALVDSTYELTDESRKVVASQIKDLDEAAFDKWQKDFDVIAAKKKTPEELSKEKKDKEMEEEAAKKKSCKASEASESTKTVTTPDAKQVAAEAIAQTVAVAQAGPPNTTTTQVNDLDKYREAFSLNGFNVK